MLATVLFGGVAFGSPATDYIDQQMAVDARVAALYLHYTASIVGAQPDPEKAMAAVQEEARAALSAAQGLPAWPGGDHGLNAAVTQRAEHGVLWFEQTLPTMVALDSGAHPRDADQLQFESLLHVSEVTEIQDLDRINDALAVFAKNNRVLLEDPEDLPPKAPDWVVELPGRPSSLTSLARVNFAIAHNNEMVLLHDGVLEEWNQGIEMDPPGLIAHKVELERAVRELKAVPPWMGDDTLTVALSSYGDGVLKVYDLMIQAAELDMRRFLFGKKRRQREGLVDQVNDALDPMDASVQQALEEFVEGWRIAERDQYLTQLAAWVAEQP